MTILSPYGHTPRTMKPPVALLTVSEVADLVRVSTMTVYRWVDDGTLPSVKLGGTIRFRRSDIDALLASDGPT